MVFEYKLVVTLSEIQQQELITIIESHPLFHSHYEDYGSKSWEYRTLTNDDFTPDTSITLEKDGLYICQYQSDHVWNYLEAIKSYLETHNLSYDIIVDTEEEDTYDAE